jgi:hypothetical protein
MQTTNGRGNFHRIVLHADGIKPVPIMRHSLLQRLMAVTAFVFSMEHVGPDCRSEVAATHNDVDPVGICPRVLV